jgi:hypothetical protein
MTRDERLQRDLDQIVGAVADTFPTIAICEECKQIGSHSWNCSYNPLCQELTELLASAEG